MVKQIFPALLALLMAGAVWADTVLLKDKASVSGKVLAEKHDQVVVDLGYTVITVPRNQIVRVTRSDKDAAMQPQVVAPALPETPRRNDVPATTPPTPASFYTAPLKPATSRTVRELVNQLGESVVQVRTPGGLGSG